MSKKQLAFFAFMLWFQFSLALNNIQGKLLNERAQPISGAHIHLGSQQTQSDGNGLFTLSKPIETDSIISIHRTGYQDIEILVRTLDLEKLFVLTMALDENRLNNVIITAPKRGTTKWDSPNKLSVQTIENYSNKNLGDALKEIAGVASLKTGNTVVKPIIDGFYGSRVAVLNNGVKLEDQQWGTEHAPNFDINFAGSISIIKGASTLQYAGDALGGVVLLQPNELLKDSIIGKTILNYDTNGRGGSVTTALQKGNTFGWSWNTVATFKYMGDKTAADYVLSNTGNRENDFSGELQYRTKKLETSLFYSFYDATIGILSASHTGSVNDLYLSINSQTPSVIEDFTYSIENPKQEVQHHIVKAKTKWHINDMESLDLQYDFQYNNRKEYDVRRSSYADLAALDLDLKTHTITTNYKKRKGNWEQQWGFNLQSQSNYADPATGIRPLIPIYDKTTAALFGIVNYNFENDWAMEAGIRYDHTNIKAVKYYLKTRWEEREYDTNYASFIVGDYDTQWLTRPKFTFRTPSANIGLLKKFNSNWKWVTNIGLTSRNPNPSELFSDGLHHSTGIIELGDLDLKTEQAVRFSTTFSKTETTYAFSINPFLNVVKNYMYLTPTGFETTIRGAFPVYEYEQTNAIVAGLSVQSNWDLTDRWTHLLTASYVYGNNQTDQEALIDIPPVALTNTISYHRGDWHNFEIGLKNEFVGYQNRYPDNDFTTTIVSDNELESVVVAISKPPPAYSLWHINSKITIDTFKKTTTTFSLSVQNLFNLSYRDYLNKQRFFADELGRSVQFQLKFNY